MMQLSIPTVASTLSQQHAKVYADGRAERFDGQGNFPSHQDKTEVLRLTPSNDKAKVQAAASVFERCATESISFTALAHYLNDLGMVSCYGQPFESRSVQDLLADPIYLGYATWNKTHDGKFHRYTDGKPVLELNYDGKQSKNKEGDWIQSGRLFAPLVSLSIWNTVREKLKKITTRAKAPHSHRHYLAGLLVCGNCGKPMIAGNGNRHGKNRYEYQCGSYTKAVRYKTKCGCLRNGVFQDEIERFVERYLEETGKRLEELTKGMDCDHLTDHLQDKEGTAWTAFRDGIGRLTAYLAEHHPDAYADLIGMDRQRRTEAELAILTATEAPPGLLAEQLAEHPEALNGQRDDLHMLGDFAADCVDLYQVVFDPAVVARELGKLKTEYHRHVDGWADLPTKRAKDTAKAKLAELEARMEELEQQQENAADVVLKAWTEMRQLQTAIADAQIAMRAEGGERTLRRKADAIRKVVQRIEATFTATGITGRGPGTKASKLVKVTIFPLVGEAFTLDTNSVIPSDSGSPPPNDTALTP